MQTKLYITSCFTVFILFFSVTTLTAQSALDKEIDSLHKVIAKAAPDTNKLNAYLGIIPKLYTHYLLNGNLTADSLTFCKTIEDCRTLSININDPYGHGTAYIWEAYFYNLLQNNSRRDDLLQKGMNIFRTAKDKNGLANALFFKAEMRSGVSTDSARLICYDSSAKLAEEAGNAKKHVQALRAIADIHRGQGKLDLAIQELLNLLEIQKKNGDDRIHFTSDMLAYTYSNTGNVKEALRHAINSLTYCRKFNDTGLIVTFYQRLGYVYKNIYNYDKSVYYFQKALDAFMPGQPDLVKQVTVSIVATMASVRIKQGMFKEASQVIAEYHRRYPEKDPKSLDFMNFIYLDLDYYTGNYKEADKRFRLMEQHIEDWPFVKQFIVRFYTKGGQLYTKLNQPDRAAFFADSSKNMMKNTREWGVLMDNYLSLYQVDSIKGNLASAMQHYQQYKAMSDSIQKDVADKNLAELAVQFETDQKNTELNLLSGTNRLQQETIHQGKKLRNAMIGGSALLLCLLFLTYNRFRIKKKANAMLQEKQDEINWQNTVLEKMVVDEKRITEEKDKLIAEKEWLMKEINHRVKNNLQVVMSLLNSQSIYLKDEAALNAIHESKHRVHAISLIHRKLYQSDHLMTVIEMNAYIKEVVEYLSENLDVQNRISFGVFVDAITLDVTQAVPVGLIINEAVTNAVKYAFPDQRNGQVDIHMYRTENGNIELLINDNGIGLPSAFNWQHTDSLGMSLMQGLSRQLNGTFDLAQQNGLSIKINFERINSPAQ